PPASYTLSLHDALPISGDEAQQDGLRVGRRDRARRETNARQRSARRGTEGDHPGDPNRVSGRGLDDEDALNGGVTVDRARDAYRSEEHTSELQSRGHLV